MVKVTRRQPVASSSNRGEADVSLWQTYYCTQRRQIREIQLYTWVLLPFGEGICGKSPFTKCGSSSQICVPQPQFLFFYFYKSDYLKTQHLGFSFKSCVLKNVCLDNVGPNTSLSTFLAQNARCLVDNAGLNPLLTPPKSNQPQN